MSDNEEKLNRILEILERYAIGESQDKSKIVGFLTITEAADLVCKSKHTVYGLASRGKIPCSKNGNRLLFEKSALIAWVKAGERPVFK